MYDTELKGSLRQNELLGYGIALFQGLSNIAINGAYMYEWMYEYVWMIVFSLKVDVAST